MRDYHRRHQWRLSNGGLFIPHAYWDMTPESLSYWDDVGFILNGRRVIVWWRHPRDLYTTHIESLAWEEAGEGPRDNWLFEGGTKNFKQVGKSGQRRKLMGYTSRGPSEAQRQHYDKISQIEVRLRKEGIDFDVRPSWRWNRLTWAMGVSLVAPLEVRSEQELAEVARLARRLILRQATLDRDFPGYVYDRASWLEDQNSELAIVAADTGDLFLRAAEVFGSKGHSWMTKPHDLLDGKSPKEYASSEAGNLKVRQILNAIKHGGVA